MNLLMRTDLTCQLNSDLRTKDLPGDLISLVQLDAIRERLGLLDNFYQWRRYVESVRYNDRAIIGLSLHVKNTQPVYVEDSLIAWQLQYDVLILIWPKRIHARKRNAFLHILLDNFKQWFINELIYLCDRFIILTYSSYYPYSSGTFSPLLDGCGPRPTQKYVSTPCPS